MPKTETGYYIDDPIIAWCCTTGKVLNEQEMAELRRKNRERMDFDAKLLALIKEYAKDENLEWDEISLEIRGERWHWLMKMHNPDNLFKDMK